MATRNTVLTRRASRKKGIATLEARRKPASELGAGLGAYRRKHPQTKITPGHRRVLKGRVSPQQEIPATRNEGIGSELPARTTFLIFCIKRILTSANLAVKEGRNWRLIEDMAGVSSGEPFTSLDACAHAIASSLQAQYPGQPRLSAA